MPTGNFILDGRSLKTRFLKILKIYEFFYKIREILFVFVLQCGRKRVCTIEIEESREAS